MIVEARIEGNVYAAAIFCYDNPSNEGNEFEIPLIRWRRYVHKTCSKVILQRMTLVIFSSNEMEKIKHGTCVGTKDGRTVRFHSTSGEVYELAFTSEKINKSIEESGKRKGILAYVPIYEEGLFKMKNPIISGIQKNMASRLFVKEWIGALIVTLYDITARYMDIVRGKKDLRTANAPAIATSSDKSITNLFLVWWPLSKPRVLQTWLREILEKETVETIDFVRVFPGISGFTRLYVGFPETENGTPLYSDPQTYVLHLMDKEKSEFTAFLTKGDNELLGNENEARLVINENFVLSSKLEASGYAGSSNYGCYLRDSYVYINLVQFKGGDLPFYPNRSPEEWSGVFYEKADQNLKISESIPYAKNDLAAIQRKAAANHALLEKVSSEIGGSTEDYFKK